MTTRKPPPPSFRPTAGFSSVTEAVRHFAAEGKTPDEIATLTGSAVATVRRLIRKARMQRIGRAARGLSLPQRIKVKQAYVAYLDFMVIALKSDRDALHQICRFAHVNKEPALPPEQEVDEAEPARAGLVDTPDVRNPPLQDGRKSNEAATVIPASEPKPMMVMKLDKRPMDLTGDGRFVTLKARSGAYLALDGSRLIEDKRHAYRGTPQQAQRMRETTDPAWGLQIIPYSNQKG